MYLCKPSFEIWKQEPGLQGIYKQIEKAAKVCYKSEGNITEDSAQPFIDNVLLKRQHYSPLEHGTVYLNIHWKENIHEVFEDMFKFYTSNPYSKIVRKIINKEDLCPDLFISANYRVLVEHNRLKDLGYLCKPTEFHEKRITVHFVCDRGVSHEFVRHRVFSFAQESTRYCNYSKDKFGNEVTYIMPCWIPYKEGQYEINEAEDYWGNYNGDYITLDKNPVSEYSPYYKTLFHFIKALDQAEMQYFNLLNSGWIPQQARTVLPNALKTELVMTGFVSDWKDFFWLRSNKYGKGGAHPSASELADSLYEEFIKRGYINEKNS